MHLLRFFDDYGTGWLWAGNEAAFAAFDVGPLDGRLPLSPATRQEAEALSDLHFGTLNMDDPLSPLPLSPAFCDDFNARAHALFRAMQNDLGPGFALVFQQDVLEPRPRDAS